MRGVGNYASFHQKAPAMPPKYATALDAIRTVVQPKRPPEAVFDYVVGHLRSAFPHYSQVKISVTDGLEGPTRVAAVSGNPSPSESQIVFPVPGPTVDLGALEVRSAEPSAFRPEDQTFLRTVADDLGKYLTARA